MKLFNIIIYSESHKKTEQILDAILHNLHLLEKLISLRAVIPPAHSSLMDFTVLVFSHASHPWLVFTAILLPGNCLMHCDRPPLGSIPQAKPSLVGRMQTGYFTNDPVYIYEEESAIWAFY